MKNKLIAVLLSWIWISLSEFIRNEYLFKKLWINHYHEMGISFPAEPVNGIVWGLWALIYSIYIYILTTRFSFYETIGLAWLSGFLLMWVVIGNLGVLPFKLLQFAIPLSFIEVLIATIFFFHRKIHRRK